MHAAMWLRRIKSLTLISIISFIFIFLYTMPLDISDIVRIQYSNQTRIFEKYTLIRNLLGKAKNFIEFPINNSDPNPSPFPYKFLINPVDLCKKGPKTERNLSLVILVCTAVKNVDRREAVRNTWGSAASATNNTGFIRLAFLLGSTTNETLQTEIELEASKYSDIIQQDFIDSYQNLTLKSVMMLKWVTDYCPKVSYILKADDDMYVNVPHLLFTLAHSSVNFNVMYGYLMHLFTPHRQKSSKWFVPKEQFKYDIFPDFLSGTSYVMSRDVPPKLLDASNTVPFLWLEDVFVTGLCANKSGVQRLNLEGFSKAKRLATGCAFEQTITGHFVTVKDMYKIFRELQQKPLICKKVLKTI